MLRIRAPLNLPSPTLQGHRESSDPTNAIVTVPTFNVPGGRDDDHPGLPQHVLEGEDEL